MAAMGASVAVAACTDFGTAITAATSNDAVITGTNFIEKRLRTLGLRPIRLSAADPDLLLHKDENWGSYYDTDPHVLAGQVDRGYRSLQKALGATYTKNRVRLLPRLHYRDVSQ